MRKYTNFKKEIEENLRIIYKSKEDKNKTVISIEKIVKALNELNINEPFIMKFYEKSKTGDFLQEELENFITDVLVKLKK